MKQQPNTAFRKMLENERSFDRLFCDVKQSNNFAFYYNRVFAEDPVFNHVVVDDEVLEDCDANMEELLDRAVSVCRKLSVPASIFVEDFWTGTPKFEKVAVEKGFRILGQMQILSKGVMSSFEMGRSHEIVVKETQDVELWNKVFMGSYSIPSSWKEELLRREREILRMHAGTFLLAMERSYVCGCLLLHKTPNDLMGVYCVGTLPEKRGRGVARAMMNFSEKVALENDCKTVTLQTLSADNVAPMYVKLGYKAEFGRDILQAQ